MHVQRTVALILACMACGSERTESPSGKVLGSSFIPPNGAAALSDSTDCAGTQIAIALIGFASYPAMCDAVADSCLGKADARTVVVRMQRFGTAIQPAFGPGSYSVGATTEAAGTLVVYAGAVATDATCGTAGSADSTHGTIVIDRVDASAVRGRVDLTFDDGGTFAGPFVTPRCGVIYDACGGDVCGGTPTCN